MCGLFTLTSVHRWCTVRYICDLISTVCRRDSLISWVTTELDTEGDHTAGHSVRDRSLNLKFRWI